MSAIKKINYLKNDKIYDLKNKKKIDKVFINMKKRGSYTNFKIDYPWLTF